MKSHQIVDPSRVGPKVLKIHSMKTSPTTERALSVAAAASSYSLPSSNSLPLSDESCVFKRLRPEGTVRVPKSIAEPSRR